MHLTRYTDYAIRVILYLAVKGEERTTIQCTEPFLVPTTSFELNDETRATIRARIYGIARFREAKSVEELFDLMKRFGKYNAQSYMGDISTALMVLTGVDHGRSQAAWTAWWNENKRKLKVSPELPKLPRKTLYSWSRYWGLELPEERRKRRGERGDDPEGDGPAKRD